MQPKLDWRTLLSNPVQRLPLAASFALALGTALVSLSLSRVGVGFDGAVDIYRSTEPVPFTDAFLHQIVAWPFTAAVMWTGALAVMGHRRFLTFLGAVGVARLPMLAAGLIGALLPMPAGDSSASAAAQTIRLALTAPFMGLFVLWLFQAFRHASGLSGARLVITFLVALLAAVVTGEWLLQAL